jgi:hypothetical protein
MLAATDVHWTDEVIAITSIVTAAGIIFVGLGAWISYRQLKDSKKLLEETKQQVEGTKDQLQEMARAREADATRDLSRRWDEADLVESRQLALRYDSAELDHRMQALFDTGGDEYFKLMRAPNFFEDLGIAVETGTISLDWVQGSVGTSVRVSWRKWEVYTRRLQQKQPTAYEHFERLAKLMADRGVRDPHA